MWAYELAFLKALGATILIETVALCLLSQLSFFRAQRPQLWRLIFVGIFCSFATLPYLRFIGPMLAPSYTRHMIGGEIRVVIMEMLMLNFILQLDFKKAFLLSLLVNAISFGIGKLLEIL